MSYRIFRTTCQARDDYHDRSLIELWVLHIRVDITLLIICKRTHFHEQSAINKYKGALVKIPTLYSSQGQTKDLGAMLTERLLDPVQSNRPFIRGYEQLPVTFKTSGEAKKNIKNEQVNAGKGSLNEYHHNLKFVCLLSTLSIRSSCVRIPL